MPSKIISINLTYLTVLTEMRNDSRLLGNDTLSREATHTIRNCFQRRSRTLLRERRLKIYIKPIMSLRAHHLCGKSTLFLPLCLIHFECGQSAMQLSCLIRGKSQTT